MSIATLSELETELAALLHRTADPKVLARLGDFILMGESRLNRELRMQDMIQTATGTLSTSVRTLALPTRYQDKVRFQLDDPLTELAYVPPGRLMEYSNESAEAGQPKRFTVTDTFQFDKVPDAAYAYTLVYFQGYRLTDDGDTNYLLTNYPQAYLYAACQYAAVYCRNWKLAESMALMSGAEIRTIKLAEKRRRSEAEATLTTELGRGSRYSIDQG